MNLDFLPKDMRVSKDDIALLIEMRGRKYGLEKQFDVVSELLTKLEREIIERLQNGAFVEDGYGLYVRRKRGKCNLIIAIG